jgi:hypothetical protein
MPQLQYPSFVPFSIPNEDVDSNRNSSMELDLSSMEWLGPEDQLGLKPDDQAGVLAKGKIKHHETEL